MLGVVIRPAPFETRSNGLAPMDDRYGIFDEIFRRKPSARIGTGVLKAIPDASADVDR